MNLPFSRHHSAVENTHEPEKSPKTQPIPSSPMTKMQTITDIYQNHLPIYTESKDGIRFSTIHNKTKTNEATLQQ